MITALSWIPKGAARSRPAKYEITPAEYDRIKELARVEEENLEEGEIHHQTNNEDDDDVDITDLPPELKMSEYDEDENDNDENDFFHEKDDGEYDRIEVV
jgi:periodic tryptophan protein 1